MRRSISVPWLIAGATAAANANAQSFDCRRAHFADEKVICHEPDLGRLDNRLDSLFRHRIAGLPRRESDALQRKETDWVVSRRQCGHNYECIEHSYRERIADLSAALPDVRQRGCGSRKRRDTATSEADRRTPGLDRSPIDRHRDGANSARPIQIE
jgi:uncharacterized protein